MSVLLKSSYLALTNFGLRFYQEHKNKNTSSKKIKELTEFLDKVYNNKYIKVNKTSEKLLSPLIEQGFIEKITYKDTKKLVLKYKRNPLEHVQRLVFEFTTKCNFNCLHCRNGSLPESLEMDTQALKNVSDKFILLGIKKFEFIGGEVSKYGNGWLDLAAYINKKNNKIVTIYTNGWWLEKKSFEAAGKKYQDEKEYLEDLKLNGVTHIIFSIDGPAEIHDKSRKQKGLYNRILNSFNRIKKIGIKPRVSIVLNEEINKSDKKYLSDIAEKMYNLPEDIHSQSKSLILNLDDTNTFSNLIDIGNSANINKGDKKIDEITPNLLRCMAFYRPFPGLGIKVNGNLTVCPLLDAGEGYGNIHKNNIISILNNMQNTFVYKLHAEKKIFNYLKYLDREIFGDHYSHICSIRTILTILARRIENEKKISPERIREINLQIAKYAGFR